MKGLFCFLGCFIAILLLGVGGVIAYLGYQGFVPGVSEFFGSTEPKDLGVTYTDADYESFMVKSGATTNLMTQADSPSESISFTGAKDFQSVPFSQSEITARVNNIQWAYTPMREVQVKCNLDGTMEVSGVFIIDNLVPFLSAIGYSVSQEQLDKALENVGKIPVDPVFYIKVFPIVSNNTADITIQEFELGRLEIDVYPYGGDSVLSEIVTKVFNEVDGFYVRSGVINEGELIFDGTAPTSVTVLPDQE